MTAPAITAFLHVMAAAGMRPVEPIMDRLARGELVRFRAEGDKPGKRNGWAKVYLDERPAGVFGHWRTGERGTWSAGASALSRADRRALSARFARERADRAAREHAGHVAAQARALALWEAATPATVHPYASAKGLALDGLRVAGGNLLVPMRDLATGALWNVQRIPPEPRGTKRFSADARVSGTCWGRGAPGATLALAEGMATAAALHAATKACSVAAMTAGNLLAVALAMRRRWPEAAIIVGADMDPAGKAKATEAARAISGRVARPPHPLGDPPNGWDFDDALRTMGADAVRAAFASAAYPDVKGP